jgi:hypothetical protein
MKEKNWRGKGKEIKGGKQNRQNNMKALKTFAC